jgi:sortase A
MTMGKAGIAADLVSFEEAYTDEPPDQSLWSESRIKAYEASKAKPPTSVVAILSIPDIGLKVPVYKNVSDLSLNRGAGLIEGMASPDDAGNVGIAGHRDGYFRVLKDVKTGDRLILQTKKGSRCYKVSQTLLVDPDNVKVLAPSEENTVTLVNCYPFYFVGPAPRRFIVKAQLEKNEF